MNIIFEEIFNLSISKFKENWKKMTITGIIYGLVGIALFLIVILGLMILPIGLLFGIASLNSSILTLIAAFVTTVVVIFGLFVIAFFTSTSPYVIAKVSFENREILEVLKSICTKSNLGFYTKKVMIPSLIALFLYLNAVILGFIISGVVGVILFIVLLVLLFIYLFNLEAVFMLSLYKGVDITANSKTLTESFTRGQILKAYLVQVGLYIILGIASSVLNLLPIIGFIFGLILVNAGQAAITQAMMIKLNGQEDQDGFTGITNATPNTSVTLTSSSTTVEINSFGAQIKSLMTNQKEYMWQADPEYWGRTAPVLFPFVGKLKDDKYIAGDKTIAMNQHGFLRDREFKVIAQTANSATFEYTSTLADYELYPCDFTVQITYQLIDRKLETKYNVINNSSYQIPYQIGAHPAFNVESVDDLTVVFPTQTVTQHYFENGLQLSTEEVTIDELQLSYDLINKNIPCYSGFSSNQLVLKNKGEDFIKFDFNSMNYLAIWSPEYKNAKFICIEPWNGICSRKDQSNYLLENKDGMNFLPANSSQSCSYTFEIC